MKPAPVPHPVDIHVGRRLRLARLARGHAQQTLGEAIGVSAQQVQKYECGLNRLSASALFRFSGFLERPVAWFFEGLEATGPDPGRPDAVSALMASREGAQMALSMARLSPALRRKVLAVVKAFLSDDLGGVD